MIQIMIMCKIMCVHIVDSHSLNAYNVLCNTGGVERWEVHRYQNNWNV